MSAKLKVSSATVHFGEEPFLSGTKGSGTIFFCGCSLHCIYCQNYQISQDCLGTYISEEDLAKEMIKLQLQGCHNINLVSPTHFVPQILKALALARELGLCIPLVYNTNGYESLETLKLVDGIIDIYLPDIKYSNNVIAEKLSGVKNYVENSRIAIAEMFRQVGNLKGADNFIVGPSLAESGLIVRHLILPNDLAGSFESLEFLKSLSADIWVGLMSQYHPCYQAGKFPEINRTLQPGEYNKVIDFALKLGLKNLLVQDPESHRNYLPDFTRKKPFKSKP